MRPSTSPTASAPAFARFAAAAERHVDDPHAIADQLFILLQEDRWLSPRDQRPGVDSYRQHLLYVSPTRRLSIVSLVWQPGQRTPIHDHIAWCVVGVYRGLEHETRYKLIEDDDGGQALLPTGIVEAHPGHVEALAEPKEDIHCVTAGGDEKTISIHVYGADIERRGTSIYRRFDGVRELAGAITV
jgi:predicted metal-dependent enzyme (double-stranded beta helix superfamily)